MTFDVPSFHALHVFLSSSNPFIQFTQRLLYCFAPPYVSDYLFTCDINFLQRIVARMRLEDLFTSIVSYICHPMKFSLELMVCRSTFFVDLVLTSRFDSTRLLLYLAFLVLLTMTLLRRMLLSCLLAELVDPLRLSLLTEHHPHIGSSTASQSYMGI